MHPCATLGAGVATKYKTKALQIWLEPADMTALKARARVDKLKAATWARGVLLQRLGRSSASRRRRAAARARAAAP